MQSRLVHIELETNHETWLKWASKNNIDYRITSYINFKPGQLFKFDPDHNDHTFASPRTWEFVSKLLKLWPNEIKAEKLPLLAGAISEPMAREFVAYCKIFEELPTIQDIISKADTLEIPSEPSTLYALSGSIAHNMKESNIDNIMQFVNRMPPEFQVITVQETLSRNKSLLTSKSMREWRHVNVEKLF